MSDIPQYFFGAEKKHNGLLLIISSDQDPGYSPLSSSGRDPFQIIFGKNRKPLLPDVKILTSGNKCKLTMRYPHAILVT